MTLLSNCISEFQIKKTIKEIRFALKRGVTPEKISTGTFETYIMKDDNGIPRAIFKPSFKHEEEIKECAAYLLDYKNFAKVPATLITSFEHEIFNGNRKGSCQLFFHGRVLTQDDLRSINPQSVRRIASLDIRLLNIDRNINNFLIGNNGVLIPIDHNLILPEHFGECYFAWADWKESHTPFNNEEKKYLCALDPIKDRKMLLALGLSPLSANLSFFATIALQLGISLGFTAHQLSFFFEMRRSRHERNSLSWTLLSFKDILNSAGYKNNQDFTSSIEPFKKTISSIFLQASEEFAIKGIT